MNEMYSAMPGSPITYLAGDISAGQTTIAVADDTALPDAPNICTIGYGEHIETIRYGAKSNGVLQQVTRGIEGSPRAWQSGTEVARFFTAHDHNAIIEKITENADNHMTHINESATDDVHGLANAVIVESGSNANGTYIKFGDGTMRCRLRREKSVSNVSDTVQGITVRRSSRLNWVYPQPFVGELPSIIVTGRMLLDGSSIATAMGNRVYFETLEGVAIQFYALETFDEIHFSAMAEGRWKE